MYELELETNVFIAIMGEEFMGHSGWKNVVNEQSVDVLHQLHIPFLIFERHIARGFNFALIFRLE
jgi:hypothetical protein